MKDKPIITLNENGDVTRVQVPAGQFLERNLNMLFNKTAETKIGYMSVCKRCERFYPTPRPVLGGYCPGCKAKREGKQ